MRKYELLIILNAEIAEEELDNLIERITQNINKEGIEISGIEKWGKRRLAYEIRKSKKGFYLLVQFSCEPQAVREIEKGLKFIDGIERFMTVVLSDNIDLSASRASGFAKYLASASPGANNSTASQPPSIPTKAEAPKSLRNSLLSISIAVIPLISLLPIPWAY